ncbi:MAG: iron-sulfur cluster assembly protein [Vicinamibacteria bacterium]|nr:iron-sulfur cluster assembly protein [Vicinamibacteria bacterium]
MREPRTVSRDIFGALVPYGTPHELKAGETVYLTQSLGGSHTCVTEMGYMVRIDGRDADAIGEQVDAAPTEAEIGQTPLEQVVWDRLKTCYDPEIPVNIVDLGLVYSVNVTEIGALNGDLPGRKVSVRFALTAPGCGMGDVLKQDIIRKVSELPHVVEADVDVTFDPPWTQDLMSDAARLQLGLM